VVYLDHRGNGRSTGEPNSWTLAQWGDDIHAFCQALGIDKPAVLGLSFGGMVTMSYAARHPEGPSRLILSSTAARMDLPATYAAMERLGGPEARRIAETFWASPSPEAVDPYLQVCMPLYSPNGAQTAEARKRAITRTEVMLHFIDGEQRTLDLLGGLANVRCPTRSRRPAAPGRSTMRCPAAWPNWTSSKPPVTASTATNPTTPRQ
jgi:proline iminopeptidase